MIAFIKLETLKISKNTNHYALKKQMWVVATKAAWKKLDELSTTNNQITQNAA